MIGQLHAGKAWLHLACWESMSSFLGLQLDNCMLGQHVYNSMLFCLLACDWLINNGCFNSIDVSFYFSIAHYWGKIFLLQNEYAHVQTTNTFLIELS